MDAMKTKLDLTREIARLENIVRDQESAVSKMTADAGVTVTIPWAPHSANGGHAPYVRPDDSSNDVWRGKVLPIVVAVVRKHGIKWGRDLGAFGGSELALHEDSTSSERYVVPTMIADMLIDLMNAAADFGNECYRAGIEEGVNITKQLAEGSVSMSEYEDRVAREKACDCQGHKRYRRRSYK